jgi:prevent-host-death family protein
MVKLEPEGSVMDTVNISTFKATCLSLLKKVKKTGRPILVLKRGVPVARILPPLPPEKPESWLGSFRHTGRITGDIIAPAADDSDWDALSQ